jgi:hypothetical protein
MNYALDVERNAHRSSYKLCVIAVQHKIATYPFGFPTCNWTLVKNVELCQRDMESKMFHKKKDS